ncbi:MAG TPA: hypothetical protein VFS43_37640 [Polyangiaceae bacterium]|nr:hypothetical protein [Polyangiaceae bacterium]
MSTIRFSAVRLSSALALAATLSTSLFAGAQEPPAARGRGKAKRPAAPALKAPAAACAPECRPGYACVQGECVAKCNPACGAGERCTDAGECELVRPSASKPPAPGRHAPKPPREAKPAPAADQGEGNNWGVPPPGEAAHGGEPAEEGETQAAAATRAEAEPTASESGEAKTAAAPAEAPADRRHGVRRHDGFYLRLGLGPAALSGTGDGGDVDLSGTGAGLELALGGTVAPGLVVGGGSYPTFLPTLYLEADGPEVKAEDGGVLTLIGPFVDYYPNAQRGLHVQGALGLSTTTLSMPSGPAFTGSSAGVMLGVGYEWWVGEQWSMGVLGRLMHTSPTLDNGRGESEASLTTFGLLGTFTYH